MDGMAVKLSAPNDANGNPQRVFAIFDSSGSIVAAVDESYDGNNALQRAGFPNVTLANLSFPVEQETYKALLRDWGEDSPPAIIRRAEKLLEGESLRDVSESSRYEGSGNRLLAAALDLLATDGCCDDQCGAVDTGVDHGEEDS
jgi:hypothetical protein